MKFLFNVGVTAFRIAGIVNIAEQKTCNITPNQFAKTKNFRRKTALKDVAVCVNDELNNNQRRIYAA